MSAATWIDAQDTAARPLFPHAAPWTVDEFMELPELEGRIELLDGSILMAPAPGGDHQRVVRNLVLLFFAVLPDDWDVVPEANLKVTEADLFIPDVMVISRPDTQPIYKPADVALAVEIVSPGSTRKDREVKPPIYAAAGIRWYMRIELQGSNSPEVFVYRLKDGSYVEHVGVSAGQVLHLTDPVEVSFDPAALLRLRM